MAKNFNRCYQFVVLCGLRYGIADSSMFEVETKTKSSDPRVATAIAHWAPRFVSNGVLLADFEEVTAGIDD